MFGGFGSISVQYGYQENIFLPHSHPASAAVDSSFIRVGKGIILSLSYKSSFSFDNELWIHWIITGILFYSNLPRKVNKQLGGQEEATLSNLCSLKNTFERIQVHQNESLLFFTGKFSHLYYSCVLFCFVFSSVNDREDKVLVWWKYTH